MRSSSVFLASIKPIDTLFLLYDMPFNTENFKKKLKIKFKSKKDFKPHKMYKKGKKDVMAKTYEMHLEFKKKGYSHTPLKNKFLNRYALKNQRKSRY